MTQRADTHRDRFLGLPTVRADRAVSLRAVGGERVDRRCLARLLAALERRFEAADVRVNDRVP